MDGGCRADCICNKGMDRMGEIPKFDEFVTIVLAAAAAFGIVNNPVNKTGF